MINKPTYEELEQRIRDLEEEISKSRQLTQSIEKTRRFAKSLIEAIREPLIILDEKLKVVTATHSFYKTFRVTPRQIQGKLFYDVHDRQWDIPELRSFLQDIISKNTSFESFEIEHNFETLGPKILYLNASQVVDDKNNILFIMLSIEDISGRVQTEKEIQKRETTYKEAEKLALLGHWELDLVSNTLYWSDEIYRMFELEPREFGATYEAFLKRVHPDDRKFVDTAYFRSVEDRTGYDIVHRLLLSDGRVKYVNEKCKTEYDEDGNPLRSLGTVQDITESIRSRHGYSGIIGRDPRMRELFETIKDLASVSVPVLIQGESGTGKELVAAAIHNEGPRAKRPFVPVNCSALPEGLLESELFGHVRGSFTGAMRDKKGRFELAHGGTLFLDEVADLPKVVQAKLLRALQEGSFERVGDEKTFSVDVRLISATNRDLKTEVEKGNFRDDLYYRINVVPLHLPPLRERKNDIPLLVENFLERAAKEGQAYEGVTKEALAVMIDYPWPGNIRELQSAIRYALIKSKGKVIKLNHLPVELIGRKVELIARGPSRKLSPQSVQSALTQAGGNKAKAAKLLGVGRATLYRFLARDPDSL